MNAQIAPSAQHDLTRSMLSDPARLREFSELILRCCAYDEPLFRQAASCLNFDAIENTYSRDDFLDPIDSLCFLSMQEVQKMHYEGNPWPANGPEWSQAVLPVLTDFFARNPDIPAQFGQECVNRFFYLQPPSVGERDRLCDGLVDYVRGVRHIQLDGSVMGMDPARKMQAYTDLPRTIRIPNQEIVNFHNEDILTQLFSAPNPCKPFLTGIRSFDHNYGSRAQGGDAWLAFGHPGGGKTNLACQTMGNSAVAGRKVLYVTTEVKAATLLMRACASVTSISLSTLRGMTGSLGDHPQAKAFSTWLINGPGRNVTVFDYREIQGVDYREKLDRMLDVFQRKHGAIPDLVIWDWIGKALDTGFETPWQKREAYNGVAGLMVSLADQLDGVTLTLAQAAKETKNRAHYAQSDTQDSKSLADGMEGALGITSLMDMAEGSTDDHEVHKEQQYLCVCKCREEQALRLRVLRNFQYSRFESAG